MRVSPAFAAVACSSPWLSQQAASFREGLVARGSVIRFARGEKIVGLEERNVSLHFLLEGAVQVSAPRADGEVVPVHVISPLEWFGEHGAVTGEPSFAEYRAQLQCVALVVPRADFLDLAEGQDAHRAAVLSLLAMAVRSSFEIAGGLSGLRPEARVRSKLHTLSCSGFTDRNGHHIISISQDELAAVSCVSRSVVSKVLMQLIGEGTISSSYRRITVRDRAKLL